MKLFELQLPHYTNAGLTTVDAMREFEQWCYAETAGFSRRASVTGCWASGARRYQELMTPYHFACDAADFEAILAKAFELFPDQLAIYFAEIGTATIRERQRAETVQAAE